MEILKIMLQNDYQALLNAFKTFFEVYGRKSEILYIPSSITIDEKQYIFIDYLGTFSIECVEEDKVSTVVVSPKGFYSSEDNNDEIHALFELILEWHLEYHLDKINSIVPELLVDTSLKIS